MRIKFWGTRGSVPAPGKETVKYGGNTTCIEVRLSDNSQLIIDAGTGIRKLGLDIIKNGPHNIDIFLTHPHWDHIQGFPFFIPMFHPDFNIIVYGWPTTNRKVKNTITYQMEGTYFPVDFSQLAGGIDFKEIDEHQINYKSAKLSFLRCNHPVVCQSIKIEEKGRTFVFMTDNELDAADAYSNWEDFTAFCKNADLLVHDAQYTPDELNMKKGWGHSSFSRVIDLAHESSVKKLALFHHDPEHSDDFIDRMVEDSKRIIGDNNWDIDVFAAMEGSTIEV